MLILNCIPESRGWAPIQYMTSLAAELFGAELLQVPPGRPSAVGRLWSVLNRRRASANSREICLVVCAGPTDLERVIAVEGWRDRFAFLDAWIIDSFWVDYIPRVT